MVTMMYMRRMEATGRILRCCLVPSHDLDPDELIEFWADELMTGTGGTS